MILPTNPDIVKAAFATIKHLCNELQIQKYDRRKVKAILYSIFNDWHDRKQDTDFHTTIELSVIKGHYDFDMWVLLECDEEEKFKSFYRSISEVFDLTYKMYLKENVLSLIK